MGVRSAIAVAAALLAAGGCGAEFEDLRPLAQRAGDGWLSGQEVGPVVEVLASGEWRSVSDYFADGAAELVALKGGGHALRLTEDFATSPMPGPSLVLSSRQELGVRLDPEEDIEVARLDQIEGGQIHLLPSDPMGRRTAWIFCKPYGITVAVADLE